MIKVEEIQTYGWQSAIRGMRNPMNSWNRSDSNFACTIPRGDAQIKTSYLQLGENDLNLMQRLYKAGNEHRKFARFIYVSMDVTAPLYWFKEFDTYKVGVSSNSCSTMHKISAKEFELSDFSTEHLNTENLLVFESVIKMLNNNRKLYLETKDKNDWWQMIQLLPSSYNQKRTITMSYENVFSIIHQRENHKLDEWREFCKILKGLPYVKEITEETDEND